MSLADEIWAALPLPAFVLGPEGKVLECNLAAQDALKLSKRNLQQTVLWQVLVFPPDIEQRLQDAVMQGQRLLVDGCDVQAFHPATHLTHALALGACHVQLTPLHGGDNSVLLTLSPKDLSSVSGAQVYHQGQAMPVVALADMLAHEIKNPLAGILGAAQLLAMGPPRGADAGEMLEAAHREHDEMTGLIVDECQRIVTLLEKVEQFGNLQPPELRAVNVHDVLDRARSSAQVGFAQHIEFKQEYDPSLPEALCDKDQLLQVVLNVVKNAAEAANAQGGRITLRTYYDSSMRVRRLNGALIRLPLHMEIIDNGSGVPEHILANVFEPFVSSKERGSGLGLALGARLIDQMGGCVTLTSKVGRTCVRLSLPASQAAKGYLR